ncbi:MAG: TolC family protein, partial [Myxococcales bacterium]|nr:TolC family protein [Myxococcales bacterium]
MIALLALALAGPLDEKVGPDALPAWATPSGEARVEGAWWVTFGDPGLTQIMGAALASNRDLRAAFARAEASHSQVQGSASALMPRVTFDANASVAPTASRGFQFGGIPTLPGQPEPPKTYTTGQAALNASWDVDLFLRNQQTLAASRHDARAADGDRDAAVLAFATRVAEGYFDVIASRLRVGIV